MRKKRTKQHYCCSALFLHCLSGYGDIMFYCLINENRMIYWLFWRRGWDSNPCDVAVKLISSQPRYDHFDTSPCMFQSAFIFAQISLRKLLERKAGEKLGNIRFFISRSLIYQGFPVNKTAKPTYIPSQGCFDRFDTAPKHPYCTTRKSDLQALSSD